MTQPVPGLRRCPLRAWNVLGGGFWGATSRLGFGSALPIPPVDLVRRALPHGIGDVGVGVQGGGAGHMADNGAQRLDVHAVFQGGGGEGVPLRYNYDKPEKPRRIKGFEVFSLVFSSFSKPKNHTEISRIIGGVSLTTNE